MPLQRRAAFATMACGMFTRIVTRKRDACRMHADSTGCNRLVLLDSAFGRADRPMIILGGTIAAALELASRLVQEQTTCAS
jgi:hypothetical protein